MKMIVLPLWGWRCSSVTLVSAMFFSSFFSRPWEEALALALPSWLLILSSSSSSFSRSWSKVWAQLSHSGTGQRKMMPCFHAPGDRLQVVSPWHCSSVSVSPGSSVFLQTGEAVKQRV